MVVLASIPITLLIAYCVFYLGPTLLLSPASKEALLEKLSSSTSGALIAGVLPFSLIAVYPVYMLISRTLLGSVRLKAASVSEFV